LLLALAWDLLLGEPPVRLHPVVWMGNFIRWLDGEGRGRGYGFAVAAATLGFAWVVFRAPTYLIAHLIVPCDALLGSILIFLWWVFLLKSSFSYRLMRRYASGIAAALESGDVELARRLAQDIVRRDLRAASAALIASAAVESLAESEVDGLVSPLFYYPLGILGPLFQRAINTLDSMIAYPYDPYKRLGWVSAKLDTAANYIPARITALLIGLGALLNGLDANRALRVAISDHTKTKSLNAGWPMASMAGALGVALEKEGEYRLGEGSLPEARDIRAAIKIFDTSFFIFAVLLTMICYFA